MSNENRASAANQVTGPQAERVARQPPSRKSKGTKKRKGRRLCHKSGCNLCPSFGFEGETAISCSHHQLKGMRNLTARRCQHPGCFIVANFSFPGQKPLFCSKHSSVGMVNRNRVNGRLVNSLLNDRSPGGRGVPPPSPYSSGSSSGTDGATIKETSQSGALQVRGISTRPRRQPLSNKRAFGSDEESDDAGRLASVRKAVGKTVSSRGGKENAGIRIGVWGESTDISSGVASYVEADDRNGGDAKTRDPWWSKRSSFLATLPNSWWERPAPFSTEDGIIPALTAETERLPFKKRHLGDNGDSPPSPRDSVQGRPDIEQLSKATHRLNSLCQPQQGDGGHCVEKGDGDKQRPVTKSLGGGPLFPLSGRVPTTEVVPGSSITSNSVKGTTISDGISDGIYYSGGSDSSSSSVHVDVGEPVGGSRLSASEMEHWEKVGRLFALVSEP